MATVEQILWRQVTDSDFVCVERSRENTPDGGGGQTYFSLSFGSHLDKAAFGRFLGLDPPDQITTERPPVAIEVAVLGEPAQRETIEFRPRYSDPKDSRDRYYIARQNRQRANQTRHPAWTAARGFPIAPDDIARKTDPRLPDLTQLKLLIGRCDDGTYVADYVNANRLPSEAPFPLAILFQPNRFAGPDGLIDLSSDSLSVERLRLVLDRARERPHQDWPSSPEIEDVQDATARAAGARSRRGQGFRQSPEERTAIDTYAMLRATTWLTSNNWRVTDRSINHPYDLYCERGAEELHVEVKGTTSDGSAVLLTPNEVEFAGSVFPAMALLIVHSIQLDSDRSDNITSEGGEIEFVCPWDVEADGTLRPTGFIYDRESKD